MNKCKIKERRKCSNQIRIEHDKNFAKIDTVEKNCFNLIEKERKKRADIVQAVMRRTSTQIQQLEYSTTRRGNERKEYDFKMKKDALNVKLAIDIKLNEYNMNLINANKANKQMTTNLRHINKDLQSQ